MALHDFHASRSMRFFGVGPDKIFVFFLVLFESEESAERQAGLLSPFLSICDSSRARVD